MNFITGLFLYLLIWWTALFTVLPMGKTHAESDLPGTMPGAPVAPQLKKKFLLTTLVAAVLWLLVFALIQSDLISFHRMVQNEAD
jgi:predicted secreted protein